MQNAFSLFLDRRRTSKGPPPLGGPLIATVDAAVTTDGGGDDPDVVLHLTLMRILRTQLDTMKSYNTNLKPSHGKALYDRQRWRAVFSL